MQIFKRAIQTQIDNYLASKDPKILFMWGPRRSGKTTLLSQVSQKLNVPIFNFDLLSDQQKFSLDLAALKKITNSVPVILIDEVQNYPEATIALKIIHDQIGTPVIATGSSELRQKSARRFDSLAGRYKEIYCLPLATTEIMANIAPPSYLEAEINSQILEQVQIFGSYPEISQPDLSENQKIDSLTNILDNYAIKDIVNIYELKNAKLAKDILTQIALQIGSEVSIREIANSLQANVVTVSNYIEIFIKNYILIPLYPFKSNLRRAVSKNRKLYFTDLGLRNALVRDFRATPLRPDKGGLFENFIVSEVEKAKKINHLMLNLYFYREYSGREVDMVLEDYHKKYTCLEIKSSENNKISSVFPLAHELKVITPKNYQKTLKSLP